MLHTSINIANWPVIFGSSTLLPSNFFCLVASDSASVKNGVVTVIVTPSRPSMEVINIYVTLCERFATKLVYIRLLHKGSQLDPVGLHLSAVT